MNQYQLPSGGVDEGSKGLHYFIPFIRDEVWKMVVVLVIILLNSAINVISPLLLGYTIDQAIGKRDLGQLFFMVGILFILYFTGLVMNYFQVKRMGNLGQRVLLKLRKRLFYKIQELPMAFFNSNKIGDLKAC
jgi:ATP-binding cassette subfamily B protein